MKRIKFIRDAVYKAGPRESWPRYVAGDVHEFEDDHADRWLRRNAAVEYADEPLPPEPEVEVIEIPADWRDAHHATKRALAKRISGEDPADTAAAEAVIEEEETRRIEAA